MAMYSPLLGQFATRDPLGYAAGDMNLHRYVGNNPTLATDPTGLEPLRPRPGVQIPPEPAPTPRPTPRTSPSPALDQATEDKIVEMAAKKKFTVVRAGKSVESSPTVEFKHDIDRGTMGRTVLLGAVFQGTYDCDSKTGRWHIKIETMDFEGGKQPTIEIARYARLWQDSNQLYEMTQSQAKQTYLHELDHNSPEIKLFAKIQKKVDDLENWIQRQYAGPKLTDEQSRWQHAGVSHVSSYLNEKMTLWFDRQVSYNNQGQLFHFNYMRGVTDEAREYEAYLRRITNADRSGDFNVRNFPELFDQQGNPRVTPAGLSANTLREQFAITGSRLTQELNYIFKEAQSEFSR